MRERESPHRRLAALLAVAAVAGAVAVFVGSATAGKTVFRPVVEPAPVGSRPLAPCPVPRSLRPAFVRASRDTALPLSMLVAVGKVESNLNVDARSTAGARGILQLMPSTAAMQLNVDDPQANVLAGARYLREMLNRFSSTDLALAAYNAGPTAVEDAGLEFPSAGVQTYVANVNALWRSFAGCA